MNGPQPRRYLQSLNAALDVLDLLGAQAAGLGVSEVARRLDMSKGAVHAILSNLEARGLVLRESGHAAYRLGRHLWQLGLVAGDQIELKQLCRASLVELTQLTGESSQLSEYCASGEVLYLERVVSPNPVQTCVTLGGRAPAHCVATGRALLAHQPAAEIERVCTGALMRYTPATVVDPARLRAELEKVRCTGYAVNPGEYRGEIIGVAAPVRDYRGNVVAAIGVSGPAYRFPVARAETVAGDVVRVAAAFSEKLGFGRPGVRAA